MATKKDYYELLGINKTATEAEIKSAYRTAALKYHPDRNPGNKESEEKFKEVSEAYETLSDGQKRTMYDQYGHAGVNGNYGGGGSGFDPRQGGQGFDGFKFHFGDEAFDIGDIFGDVFGGGRRSNPRGPRKGEDLQYNVRVNLSEVAFGSIKSIKIEHTEKCGVCNGSGAKQGTRIEKCSQCGGAGQVRVTRGIFATVQTCSACGGRGEIITAPCDNCRGKGIVQKTKTIEIKIPSGVDNGSTLRLREEGNAGDRNGVNGDLYVVLEVVNDTKFERDRENLHYKQDISFATATFGSEINVPTIDGSANMKIPPATQTGTIFRLREKGLPILGTKKRGDLLVKVNVSVPRKLSTEQKIKLKEFAKSMGENVTDSGDDSILKKMFK